MRQGREKTGDTVKLAKRNLAVHGLLGDIREGNSYYEDPFESFGCFDFVMANPPFNVDRIDKAKTEWTRSSISCTRADRNRHVRVSTSP
jgi:type I restriction enzyme M protein